MTKEKIKKKRGRPSKADLELRAREAEKQKIASMPPATRDSYLFPENAVDWGMYE